MNEITNALQTVTRASGSNGSFYENVCVTSKDGGIQMLCTDGIMSARMHADVSIDGDFCVNAKRLFECFKHSKGEVSMSLEKDKLIVKSGRSKKSLYTMPIDGFPVLEDEGEPVEIDGDELVSAFKAVQYAVAKNDSRPFLNGVCIGGGYIVAADGKQMAAMPVSFSLSEGNIIIPIKAVAEVCKTIEGKITIYSTDNMIRFVSGNLTLQSKLIAGRYPKWEKLVPESDMQIQVNRQEFIDSISGLKVTLSEKLRAIQMLGSMGRLTLASNNNDAGSSSDEIDAQGDVDSFDLAFNADQILETLSSITGDTCTIKFTKGCAAVTLAGEDKSIHILVITRV